MTAKESNPHHDILSRDGLCFAALVQRVGLCISTFPRSAVVTYARMMLFDPAEVRALGTEVGTIAVPFVVLLIGCRSIGEDRLAAIRQCFAT